MSLLKTSEEKRNLLFYFQVHQPRRLRGMRFFDIGKEVSCFNDDMNHDVIKRVAHTCYLPANATLLKLIQKNPNIKVAFSISGVALDQFEQFAPEVIDSFRQLTATGNVEILGETFYHSLACLMPGHEFEIQILKHAELIERHFGRRPTVFRNTELIYNDEIGKRVFGLGFGGIFTDGVPSVLKHEKSVNQLYMHPEEPLKIFLRNYSLSDDIAFRFSHHGKKLTADTYISWLKDVPVFENMLTIAMDYETFGEHHKKESGILEFLKKLMSGISKDSELRMVTPSDAVLKVPAHSTLQVPKHVSWADQERDLSAWLGNDMQKDAFASLMKLEKDVKSIGSPEILKQWRMLQTSDHFYYMSTKRGTDGTIHNYFSPYPSPYEAFINYMNVLTDFACQVKERKARKKAIPKSALQPSLLVQELIQ